MGGRWCVLSVILTKQTFLYSAVLQRQFTVIEEIERCTAVKTTACFTVKPAPLY